MWSVSKLINKLAEKPIDNESGSKDKIDNEIESEENEEPISISKKKPIIQMIDKFPSNETNKQRKRYFYFFLFN